MGNSTVYSQPLRMTAGEPKPSLRLFCFPYAGGSSSIIFRTWSQQLPVKVDVRPVELPGRGTRISQAPLTNLADIVPHVASYISPYLDKPFAIFGHSMGALIAFELARHLRRESGLEPVHLFVSGHAAPQLPNLKPPRFNLPHDELMAALRQLNGTAREVLEHDELMELMLPVLRADFQVAETYAYSDDALLNCPISAYGGLRDVEARQESLELWRVHTTARFALRMFEGDHFFIHQSAHELLYALARELRKHVDSPRPD